MENKATMPNALLASRFLTPSSITAGKDYVVLFYFVIIIIIIIIL